jgi:hypothetical protein
MADTNIDTVPAVVTITAYLPRLLDCQPIIDFYTICAIYRILLPSDELNTVN